MDKLAYTIASLNRRAQLASMVKSAKFSWEMNDEEKAKSKAISDKFKKQLDDNTPKRKGEEKGFAGRVRQQLGGLGRGALSTLGVTGIRAGQNLFELATWIPSLGDKLIFGSLGVNNGRGFLGEPLAWLNRYADKGVHKLRNWSHNYDYENGLTSNWVGKLNRAANGGFADAIGAFIGWGGVGGAAKNVLKNGTKKLLADQGKKTISKSSLLFGGLGATSSLFSDGRDKQLREAERKLWTRDPSTWNTYDPTGTRYNIEEGAYTPEEYAKYYLPTPKASYAGKFWYPYTWTHKGLGTPKQVRPFPGQSMEDFYNNN